MDAEEVVEGFGDSIEDDLNDGEYTDINKLLRDIKECANDYLGDYTPILYLSPLYEVYFFFAKNRFELED